MIFSAYDFFFLAGNDSGFQLSLLSSSSSSSSSVIKRHKTPIVGRQSKQDHLDFIGLDMYAHKRVFASF